MVYCVASDVKRIVGTALADSEITQLIVLADAKVDRLKGTDYTLDSNALKEASMNFAAAMVARQTPPSYTAGDLSFQNRDPKEYEDVAKGIVRHSSKNLVSYDPLAE
jgi:hypothetical protein